MFFASVHTLAHVVNFSEYLPVAIIEYLQFNYPVYYVIGLVSLRPGSLPWWQYFFYVNTGLGWVYGTAGLTGVFLIIILLIIVMFSLKVVRKKGFFEVYHWFMVTHTASMLVAVYTRCSTGPTISSFPGTSC